ncbi:hypothetical protein D3C71_2126460 [compost metagenome]
MKLADTWMNVLLNICDHFRAGERVSSLLALILTEITESTMRFTDIGEIKTHIFNKIYFFTVLSHIHFVGKLPDR